MAVLFLALGLAALRLSCVYQWWWHQRYRRPTLVDREVVRLRGRVAGPGLHQPVLDTDASDKMSRANAIKRVDDSGRPRTIRVDGSVPLIGARVLRVGDRATPARCSPSHL